MDYFNDAVSWDKLRNGDDDALFNFYWLDAGSQHLITLTNTISTYRVASDVFFGRDKMTF